uniref:Peptidase S1 domain-containing protein n=2 Tax=Octopus bimaculoides TaxID=37653 RepID=A0A0L8GGI1_OCTBM
MSLLYRVPTLLYILRISFLFRQNPYQLQIALGITELYKDAFSVRFRKVSKIVVYPFYVHGGSYPNDIALMELSAPIQLSEYIKTVCLPSKTNRFTGRDECWVTGWGDTRGRGNPNVLNKVQVRITGFLECQHKWSAYVHKSHICVGDGHAGPCRGDSGGPLVCLKRGRFLLAGVASFSNELCGVPGFPAVYTKVSEFLEWINYVYMNA